MTFFPQDVQLVLWALHFYLCPLPRLLLTPVLYLSLLNLHFTSLGDATCKHSVRETAVTASSGVSTVVWRPGWLVRHVTLFGHLWEGSSSFTFYTFSVLFYGTSTQLWSRLLLYTFCKHTTLSHIERVREGEMLDQTDSFGLGKKESSYLKTAI